MCFKKQNKLKILTEKKGEMWVSYRKELTVATDMLLKLSWVANSEN